MPKYPQSLPACIKKFVDHIDSESNLYSKSTVKFYKDQVNAVFNILVEHDVNILPYTISKEHVQWLLTEMQIRRYAVKTRKNYLTSLKKICEFYKNDVMSQVKYKLPHDARPTVDWLTADQVDALLQAPKTVSQELVIHLELFLGLRKVEVTRLTLDSIHDGYLDVLGKGTQGGKPRRVPFHRDTQVVIDKYLTYRNAVIAKYFALHPRKQNIEIPNSLMIWASKDSINPYESRRSTGIDKLIESLSDQVGFRFSSHTLRRTFGRLLYRAGVPVATISLIYGHNDTDTTLMYLGLDMDDMAGAMELFPL